VNFERLTIVSFALTDVACDVHVGKEVHLDLYDTIALAGFASTALDVEREAARLIATRLGFRQSGKPVTNMRKCSRVGGRVGARRASNRGLVDVDDLVDKLEPFNPIVVSRLLT